jgi:hypothetical protein
VKSVSRFLVMALVGVSLAACSSGDDEPEAAPTTTTTQVALPAPAGFAGEFFAMTGDEIYNAGLSRLTFSPPRLKPVTPVRRVSAISGCSESVVVAAAQESVDFSDHIQLLVSDDFGPVPGLGVPFGYAPELDEACRLLYSDAGGEAGTMDRMWRFEPGAASPTLVHEAPGMAGGAWGPGGQIAVVETTRSSAGSPTHVTGVRVLRPDGSSFVVPPVTPEPGPFEWGTGEWMAFGVSERATAFVRPDNGERRDLADWLPLAWSPDGTWLLVVEAAEARRALGVVNVADLGTVVPLGTAPEAVHEVVWHPAGVDPVGDGAP